MIRLSGLTKQYGEKIVLSGIDHVFSRGDFTVITGESGCGKTTFLRILMGIEAHGGEVRIDARRGDPDFAADFGAPGSPGRRAHMKKKSASTLKESSGRSAPRMAAVFQEDRLMEDMSVLKNLLFVVRGGTRNLSRLLRMQEAKPFLLSLCASEAPDCESGDDAAFLNEHHCRKSACKVSSSSCSRAAAGIEDTFSGAVSPDPADSSPLASLWKRMTDEERRTAAEIVSGLDALGLADEMHASVSSLSGGMKRRVGILRALIVPAEIIFFDEALRGLNAETKQRTLLYIRERVRGKTVFWVTHDAAECLAFEQARFYRLQDGRLRYVSTSACGVV